MHDERLKKSAGVDRVSRETADRAVTENRALSDDERVAEFRMQQHQSALPDLPKLPGYHVCWLTTTNPRDSIQARMRLGYEPIRPEEIPGWESVSVKTGEYTGLIGVNEMLAFKLPIALYERYMHENHRAAPDREQEMLKDRTEMFRREVEGRGSHVYEGEGTEGLTRINPAKPRFELT